MNPRLKLSPLEAAQALGVSRQCVYDSINGGLLRARKVSPRRIVIDAEDLEEYLANSVVPPRAGDWYLVWREHTGKKTSSLLTEWLTPKEFAALPQDTIDRASGIVRFRVGVRPQIVKLRSEDLTTLSTGSK